MATHTWTIDTAASPWVYSNGEATTISGTAETIAFTFDDKGDGGIHYGIGSNQDLTLADGSVLTIEADKGFTFFQSGTDGAAKTDCGSIWVRIDGGLKEEVEVASLTMANADGTGANNVTAITFEYPGKPYRWSWANVNTA